MDDTGLLESNPELVRLLTPRTNDYMVGTYSPKQEAFLLLDDVREILFGGAAGGGKSFILLEAALQFVDMPDYAALLVRATYKDLSLPGAIMDMSKQRLRDKSAHWDEKKFTWTFPSGAKLVFGHLDGPNDHYQYQGAEFQFIGVDEASQLRWSQVMYLLSRLRKKVSNPVPLRFRLASNPGGRSHVELKERYVDHDGSEGRLYLPSRLEDNPYLDQAGYEESLRALDPITRRQLRNGDWNVMQEGGLFKRHWFVLQGEAPSDIRWLRFWDLAATVQGKDKKSDPDWTAGGKVGVKDGRLYVADMRRVRATPGDVERLVKQTAELDGRGVAIRMEQEPGSSGVAVIDRYQKLLLGYDFRGIRSTGAKEDYAKPLSAAAEAGNVVLIKGNWNTVVLDELEEFPFGAHDDMVDTIAKGLAALTVKKKKIRSL